MRKCTLLSFVEKAPIHLKTYDDQTLHEKESETLVNDSKLIHQTHLFLKMFIFLFADTDFPNGSCEAFKADPLTVFAATLCRQLNVPNVFS